MAIKSLGSKLSP